MSNTRATLKSQGAVTIHGGEYASVQVSASLKSQGDLQCDSLSCSGSAKIEGSLRCEEELSCSGMLKVEGNLRCAKRLACSGVVKVEGQTDMGSGGISGTLVCERGLRVQEQLRCSGSCKVNGAVSAQELNCQGMLAVSDDVEAEHFVSHGRLEIGGLLNAELIEIELSGKSEVADIGGSEINVKLHKQMKPGCLCLETGSIEGDTVCLEATRAQVVRGRDVFIGSGCRIERVEYSGTLRIENGEVREQVRLV